MAEQPVRGNVSTPKSGGFGLQNSNLKSAGNFGAGAPAQLRGATVYQPEPLDPVVESMFGFADVQVAKEVDKLKKEQYADGIALAAQGKELPKWSNASSREAFNALKAKNASTDLISGMSAFLTSEAGADLSPEQARDYISNQVGQINSDGAFDSTVEAIVMTHVGQQVGPLAATQLAAAQKANTAGVIHEQAINVDKWTDTIVELKGQPDPNPELLARANQELAESTRLLALLPDPVVRNEAAMQQVEIAYSKGLMEMPAMMADAGIEFSLEDLNAMKKMERAAIGRQNAENDFEYQTEVQALEAFAMEATSVEELRTAQLVHMQKHKGRETDKYYNAQIATFNREANKKVAHNISVVGWWDEYGDPSNNGMYTKPQVQASFAVFENLVAASDIENKALYVNRRLNNKDITIDQRKRKYNQNMHSPIIGDKPNPIYEKAMAEVDDMYDVNPNLAARHMDADKYQQYVAIRNEIDHGGVDFRTAALRVNELANRSPEDRETMDKLQSKVDAYVSNLNQDLTDWIPFYESGNEIDNMPSISAWIKQRAVKHLGTGYADVDAAFKTAQKEYLENHVLMGNSMILIEGTRPSVIAGIEPKRMPDLMDFAAEDLEAANPDWTPDRTTVVAVDKEIIWFMLKDENGFPAFSHSMDLRDLGKKFNEAVIFPEKATQDDVNAALDIENQLRDVITEQIADNSEFTDDQINQVLTSNFLGTNDLLDANNDPELATWEAARNKLEAVTGIKIAADNIRKEREMDQYNLNSDEEYERFLTVKKVLNSTDRIDWSPKTRKLWDDGDFDGALSNARRDTARKLDLL